VRGGALVRTTSKGEGRLVPEQEHMGWRGQSTALAIFKSDSAHFERAMLERAWHFNLLY
jgi:hypothetical protein